LAGSSSYERVGASLLTAAGLAELVCSTRQEYVERAVSLTSTASALSTLRNGLRERLHASPLLDGKTYARQFEQLLREVWHQYLDRLGK
ncbi:hypothetical protein, partial [Chitinimonas sp.]|uniref:O-linked N-acetylglucosamine transferase family protein n=1 Tax=Chitinimonas sp. TaxID=1934313 RepID=UPI0035B205C4